MSNTSTIHDQTAREQHQELLATHREHLTLLLTQYARFGTYTPPHIIIDIRETQQALRPLKAWLRANDIPIADEPNYDVQVAFDAAPPHHSRDTARQTINNPAPNQGAQGIFNAPVTFHPPVAPLTPQEQRNRQAMLAKVKSIWIERWVKEGLRPLPQGYAWERFATEERKVSWDGYFSFDGVLYGLPSDPPLAGSFVQVRVAHGLLHVWSQGQLVLTLAQRACSGEVVTHPEQFRTVAPAAALNQTPEPLAHQIVVPQVARRALAEYDQLVGGEVAA